MKKKTFIGTITACAVAMFLLNSCKHNTDTRVANDMVYTNRDTTVKPGDDFFEYANGGWIKKILSQRLIQAGVSEIWWKRTCAIN